MSDEVTADTIVMRQIAELFRDARDPDVVRAAAIVLAGGALLHIVPPTRPEHRRNLEMLARAYNARQPLTGPDGDNPISDQQIRELFDAGLISADLLEFATAHCWYQRDYRTRCAEAWNARQGGS